MQELSLRSINLSELLDFYESLGCEGSRMPHFDPCQSTTHDVVRQAIIPASRQGSGGMSYAELLQQTGHVANRMPDCMVTHSWSNLFLDLVAAVVADALGHDVSRPNHSGTCGRYFFSGLTFWQLSWSYTKHPSVMCVDMLTSRIITRNYQNSIGNDLGPSLCLSRLRRKQACSNPRERG